MRQTTPGSAAMLQGCSLAGLASLPQNRVAYVLSSCAWCIPSASSHGVAVLKYQWASIIDFCWASRPFIWSVRLCALVPKCLGGRNMSLAASNASILSKKHPPTNPFLNLSQSILFTSVSSLHVPFENRVLQVRYLACDHPTVDLLFCLVINWEKNIQFL